MLTYKKHIITYCSNIFKLNKLKKLINNINNYLNIIKRTRKEINLCFSNNLANQIEKRYNLKKIIKWQIQTNICITSINGFVYQNFHTKNIKEKIYYPDWSSKKRFLFTQRLINILNILNNKKNISISTVPISFKNWCKKIHIIYLLYKSHNNIKNLKKNLKKKNYIHIDIEPEPCCIIESYKDLIFYYNKFLKNASTKTKINYICLCYDICHFSTIFDKHEKIINQIKKTNLKIGKIQISSALKTILPKNKKRLINLIKIFLKLRKSNFLHQCILKNKKIKEKFSDIDAFIKKLREKLNYELKIHCHIPIYKKKFNNIDTTYIETKNTLKLLKNINSIKHIEIESYTHHIFFKKNNYKISIKKEYYLTLKNIIK